MNKTSAYNFTIFQYFSVYNSKSQKNKPTNVHVNWEKKEALQTIYLFLIFVQIILESTETDIFI